MSNIHVLNCATPSVHAGPTPKGAPEPKETVVTKTAKKAKTTKAAKPTAPAKKPSLVEMAKGITDPKSTIMQAAKSDDAVPAFLDAKNPENAKRRDAARATLAAKPVKAEPTKPAATPKPTKAAAATTKPEPAKKGPKKDSEPRQGTKLQLIVGLLTRAKGCTTADVLAACKWPAVSMPQQAKAAGLKLRKVKDGRVTRYFAA